MNYSQYSSYLWAFLFTQTFFYLSSRRRPGSNLKIQRWIPACAGMTDKWIPASAGMTNDAGMTELMENYIFQQRSLRNCFTM